MEVFSELNEDEDPYKEMERLRVIAAKKGYDFDYDLSGQPTEFWKIDSMAKGGNAGRDAKFLSEQKHEQDYEPKRKKAYNKADIGVIPYICFYNQINQFIMNHVEFLESTSLVWSDLPITLQNKADRYDDLVDAYESAADSKDEKAMTRIDGQIEKLDAELLASLQELHLKSLETPKVETPPVPKVEDTVVASPETPPVEPTKTDYSKWMMGNYEV